MNKLVIIRGIPGSGKTTLAKESYYDFVLCEADQYFETENGYEYDRNKIKDAHAFCLDKVKQNLEKGKDVVVANTFVKLWEIEPYLKLGYPTKVVETIGEYESIHNVPKDVVERMKNNLNNTNLSKSILSKKVGFSLKLVAWSMNLGINS